MRRTSPRSFLRRLRRPQLALIVLVLALAVGYTVNALRDHGSPSRSSPTATMTVVPLSSLPPEAAQTVQLIDERGPFPYPEDGAVFHNNEHHLPSQPDGYYHEYTVPTPNSPDRGARRIITGKNGEFFYTADHYESFVKVDATR